MKHIIFRPSLIVGDAPFVSSEVTTKLSYARSFAQELGADPSIFVEKESAGHSEHNILDSGRLKVLGAPTISLSEIVYEAVAEMRNIQTPEGVYRRSKEY
ncbi:MAG: hypothetical protein ACREHC_02625 [Candidatus Levyibacteriota bacterium]